MYDLYDLSIVDAEDVAAKFAVIQAWEHDSPYERLGNWGSVAYQERVQRALTLIESRHRPFALAAFANVIYLPNSILTGVWKLLYLELRRLHADWYGPEGDEPIAWGMQFFALDDAGLVNEFIGANGIPGRLDTTKFTRIQTLKQLLDALIILSGDNPATEAVDEVQSLLSKRVWVILTDNSLSGTSLGSELDRFLEIRRLLVSHDRRHPEHVVVVVQLMTADAFASYSRAFGTAGEVVLRHGLFFDDKFKVNSPGCSLFSNKQIREGVEELCRWFHDQYIIPDADLTEMRALSGEGLVFGFKNTGLTIVTHKHTPTNSIPLLWFAPRAWTEGGKNARPRTDPYVGPFPRAHSRLGKQQKGRNALLLERVKEHWGAIVRHLPPSRTE